MKRLKIKLMLNLYMKVMKPKIVELSNLLSKETLNYKVIIIKRILRRESNGKAL